MVCFTGVESVRFARVIPGCDSWRALAHLAFCACAIFRREAAEIIRVGTDGDAEADVIPVGWLDCRGVPVPFSDSITAIALSNFSTCDCASRRSARSCWSAFVRLPIVPPRIEQRDLL